MSLNEVNEKVRGIVERCRVTNASGGTPLRTLQAEMRYQDVRDNLEHIEAYGLTSEPHVNSEGVALSLNGDPNHTVVIMVADRRYRMTGLKTGEVALYDDLGRSVYLTRDGIVINGADSPIQVKTSSTVSVKGSDINVKGSSITMEGTGSIFLKAPNISFNATTMMSTGSFSTSGDLYVKGLNVYTHVHNGDSGGTTSTPHN